MLIPAETETVTCEENAIQEPCIGMEFDSEDAAKEFYDEYATRVGFVMRIDQCRRSEVDKRILSRRLSCNKQGYYVKMRDHFGPVRKPRSSTREGCKAMMLVKVSKSGKWIVTRFEKDHTHPLVVSGRPSRNAMMKTCTTFQKEVLRLECNQKKDGKDRRIQELTLELERQDRLCDLYQEQLITFLKYIEEQNELLSTKIEVVVNSMREVETDLQMPLNL